MREIWDAAQSGDLDRAREVDTGLRPLYEALAVTTNPIPLKAALEMTGLIPTDTLRLPLVPARRGPARGHHGGARRASASPVAS